MIQAFLKAIWPYIKQTARLTIIGSLGGIVMNTAVVLPAILLGRAIDRATAWSQGRGQGIDVLWAGLAYAGGTTLYLGMRVVKRWGLRVSTQRIMASVRADALRGVLGWPIERLYCTPIGDLMARIIGDVEVMGRGVSEVITETWDTLLFSLSLIVGMLVYAPDLTLLTLLPVPLGMLLAQAVGRWVSARTTASREASAALTAFLQERLTGLRVLRLFGRVDATVDRAATLSDRLAEANLAVVRLRSGLQPLYRLLMMGGVVFALWLGGRRVAAGAMTLGAFIAYLDLYGRFVGRGHRVPQMFNSVQSGAAAFARLEPLLAPPLKARPTLRAAYVPGLDHPSDPLPQRPPHPAALSVREVTFSYPGNEAVVLDRVSLEAPAGAFIAITGPVGCGKSALARVLLGLYPLQEGQVLLDGQPLEDLSLPERVARIGYLPQNPFLFSGTVRDNIRFTLSDSASSIDGAMGEEGDLDRWIRLAALETDVRTFAQGLETEIGERGMRVSGGQRQRIALARTVAAHPGLLLLDDPFSAVDLDTEAQIVAGLRQTFGPSAPINEQATVLFFSHRLAAFLLADRVVVLDKGRIVEQGAPADLIRRGGRFAALVELEEAGWDWRDAARPS